MGKHVFDALKKGEHGSAVRTESGVVVPPPPHQVRFAKLGRNALPRHRSPYELPLPTLVTSPKRQIDEQADDRAKASRKRALCRAAPQRPTVPDPEDSELWGFPVYYSPTKELEAQWESLRERKRQHARDKQRQKEASERRQAQQEDELVHAGIRNMRAASEQHDYAQYLYYAGKYGPLDTLLFCCSRSPGRVYAIVVDASARRLQGWLRERMRALRLYFVRYFASVVVSTSLAESVHAVVRAFEQQQTALAYFKRIRWLQAAKAMTKWAEYTQRQQEVRWRFRNAMDNVLRQRLMQWRARVVALKSFKKRLKQVARQKMLEWFFDKWTVSIATRKRVKQHMKDKWRKAQRLAWVEWVTWVRDRRRIRRSCVTIQRHWKGYRARQRYKQQRRAAARMNRVYRGWLGRRRMKIIRSAFTETETSLQVQRTQQFMDKCAALQTQREAARAQEDTRRIAEDTEVEAATIAAKTRVLKDLSKILRNETHQKLQAKIRTLREAPTNDLVGPKKLYQKEITSIATQLLIEDAQEEAKVQTTASFRRRVPANLPGKCPLCQFPLAGKMRVGTSDCDHQWFTITRQQQSELLDEWRRQEADQAQVLRHTSISRAEVWKAIPPTMLPALSQVSRGQMTSKLSTKPRVNVPLTASGARTASMIPINPANNSPQSPSPSIWSFAPEPEDCAGDVVRGIIESPVAPRQNHVDSPRAPLTAAESSQPLVIRSIVLPTVDSRPLIWTFYNTRP